MVVMILIDIALLLYYSSSTITTTKHSRPFVRVPIAMSLFARARQICIEVGNTAW